MSSDRSEAPSRRVSTSCQTSPVKLPQTPPPAYENAVSFNLETRDSENVACSSLYSAGKHFVLCLKKKLIFYISEDPISIPETQAETINDDDEDDVVTCFPTKVFMEIGTSLKENIRKCKSSILNKKSAKKFSFSDDNLVRCFSDSELIVCKSKARFDCQEMKKRSYSVNDIFD